MLPLYFKSYYNTICFDNQLCTVWLLCTEALCIYKHVCINLFVEKYTNYKQNRACDISLGYYFFLIEK